MAKARAKKKRGKKKAGKRAGVPRLRKMMKINPRKKAAKRKKSMATRNFFIVVSYSSSAKKLVYYDGISWSALKSSAARFPNQKHAAKVAKRTGRKTVVAHAGADMAQVRQLLTGKK